MFRFSLGSFAVFPIMAELANRSTKRIKMWASWIRDFQTVKNNKLGNASIYSLVNSMSRRPRTLKLLLFHAFDAGVE